MQHSNPVVLLKVQLGERWITVRGRAAWALDALIERGQRGLTTLENPAPRWSHYIYLLRRQGIAIETETEGHVGAFAGHHARYRLTSAVTVLERKQQCSSHGRAA